MGLFTDMNVDIATGMDDAVETFYYSANGGSEITIVSHVFRSPPVPADGKRGPVQINDAITVFILASIVPVVTVGKDTVRLKKNLGDTTYATLTVRKIEEQAPGSFTVRIA